MLSRRRFVQALSSLPLAAHLPALAAQQGQTNPELAEKIVAWLETHRRDDGGYGWASAHQAHITPTYAAVGCYHLLGRDIPNADLAATFVHTHYPLPEERRTVRAMRYFDFQQIQTLLWLGRPVDSFRTMLTGWTRPSTYEAYYEKDALPVLQHQALALRARRLVGVQPDSPEQPWLDYFQQRRRSNGTYNNTPAADGSGGHLVNTHWAHWALEAMHQPAELQPETIDWIQHCQLPSGGFTYAPSPEIAGIDNLVYTWAALHLLTDAKQPIPQRERCLRWILSLLTPQGGFQDRPDSLPNPMATFYALDCLRLLAHPVESSRHPAPAIIRTALPADLRVFSAQIEAPGSGSPGEAVFLAEKLGIDLWCAKNGPEGWLQHTQQLARDRKLPTLFAFGNEEYGTFVNVPGLGRYSHLDDMIAPAGNTLGPFPPVKNEVYPWPKFRDGRMQQIRDAKGRLVWQFNENEELSRILLDEAIQKGTYAAISSFHFGRGNFLEYDPFLMTYSGRIPMVGLQDAHGEEPWWWGDSLSSFRTLFLARELSWSGFLDALQHNRILSVRHDRYTHYETEFGGCLPEVKEFVMARQENWCWWGKTGEPRRLPLGVLTALRPGMPFEQDLPTTGISLRVRLSYAPDNPSRLIQDNPVSELLFLKIDGQPVAPTLISQEHDKHFTYVPSSTAKNATATFRSLTSGQEESFNISL